MLLRGFNCKVLFKLLDSLSIPPANSLVPGCIQKKIFGTRHAGNATADEIVRQTENTTRHAVSLAACCVIPAPKNHKSFAQIEPRTEH